MFRITSFPTPVSPLSSVVSSPYKSALTPQNNNSLANASGVPHQRQGAQVGNPTRIMAPEATSFFRSESHLMLYRLFKFMGEGLPLTSKGRFDLVDLDHAIKVARRKAEAKNNHTVSQLWDAVATLIDPEKHPDVMIKIDRDKKTGELKIFKNFNGDNIQNLENFRNSSHNKGLNSFLAFLEDYQAYLDSLKPQSTPS
jgi:hypothetical protein